MFLKFGLHLFFLDFNSLHNWLWFEPFVALCSIQCFFIIIIVLFKYLMFWRKMLVFSFTLLHDLSIFTILILESIMFILYFLWKDVLVFRNGNEIWVAKRREKWSMHWLTRFLCIHHRRPIGIETEIHVMKFYYWFHD